MAALLALNARHDGGRVLLFLVAVVVAGEAAAYFGGRIIGGSRLAPRLSPGKTWAGFWSQLVAGGLVAVIAAPLAGRDPGLATGMLGGFIAFAAALGDLFESFLKRAAGVKDSGQLIPGHGGVLDRLDGFLFAAPALAAVTGPGAALFG